MKNDLAKTITVRLTFLDSLEEIVFNHKKSLLERDQLHQILNNQFWLFDENFSIAVSEKTLIELLKIYKNQYALDKEDKILSKTIQAKKGEYEYLVVFLTQKINTTTMNQIKDYARAVSRDSRFDKNKSKWKFIAVSNEFEASAEEDANQTDREYGLIHNTTNTKVYIKKWADVINDARLRLNFVKENLTKVAEFSL